MREIPYSCPSEADRYKRVWSDRIYSAEDIKIDTAQGPEYDSTFGHIRHWEPVPEDVSHKRPKKRRPEYIIERSSITEDPVSRVHMQIIHAYTGWPLRHFRHLGELLHVIRDAVVGK